MNKQRRKRLEAIQSELQQARDTFLETQDDLRAALEAAIGGVEEVRDEEQEAFDSLPENMQGGGQGQAMEQAVDRLEEAHGALEQLQEKAY